MARRVIWLKRAAQPSAPEDRLLPQMSPNGRTAHLNHARHYLTVLARSNDLYLRGGEFVSAAIALFDREFAHIALGQAWASSEAENSTEAGRLCLDYPNAGLYVLDLRLDAKRRVTNPSEARM